MSLNILFICEGNAEVYLLYKILKEEFNCEIEEKNLKNDRNLNMAEIKQFTLLGKVNNNNIYIGNIRGVSKLNSAYVTELIENPQFYKLDKILFIMDADYRENNESGFIRMEKSIVDIIKKIQETRNIKTDYFISPNNRDDGMIENLLIETDAPYLTPEPLRGRRNMSPYVEHTARRIALIKGMDYEQVVEQTCKNAERFFNIEES